MEYNPFGQSLRAAICYVEKFLQNGLVFLSPPLHRHHHAPTDRPTTSSFLFLEAIGNDSVV